MMGTGCKSFVVSLIFCLKQQKKHFVVLLLAITFSAVFQLLFNFSQPSTDSAAAAAVAHMEANTHEHTHSLE